MPCAYFNAQFRPLLYAVKKSQNIPTGIRLHVRVVFHSLSVVSGINIKKIKALKNVLAPANNTLNFHEQNFLNDVILLPRLCVNTQLFKP